eukprot:306358-Pelagomonas_calceolata.AAC.3
MLGVTKRPGSVKGSFPQSALLRARAKLESIERSLLEGLLQEGFDGQCLKNHCLPLLSVSMQINGGVQEPPNYILNKAHQCAQHPSAHNFP